MEVNRKGGQISIVLDSEEEAIGLHAFLSGTVHEVPPEIATKGQWLYTWFFNSVQKLAHNFGQERSVSTQTVETMAAPVKSETGVNASPKRRKR